MCNIKCENISSLKKHIENKHETNFNPEIEYNVEIKVEEDTKKMIHNSLNKKNIYPKDNSFICEFCGQTFTQVNHLTWHDTDKKCYKCILCNIKCGTEIEFREHMIIEHKNSIC